MFSMTSPEYADYHAIMTAMINGNGRYPTKNVSSGGSKGRQGDPGPHFWTGPSLPPFELSYGRTHFVLHCSLYYCN